MVRADRDEHKGTAAAGDRRASRRNVHQALKAYNLNNLPGHFVYIVRCADGTLYTGYARDPHEREKVHNSGRGAHYTACRRPVHLVYLEMCESRGEALKRECQLKRLTRPKKEALIDG